MKAFSVRKYEEFAAIDEGGNTDRRTGVVGIVDES
jgi:hypothetical protein